MKQELKGWLMDNTVRGIENDGQILRLESAGSIGLREVVEEMSREGTGLRPETLAHVVSLYQRVLTRLVLSGYSVNTGMFRLAPGFKGLVEGGVWDAERNSIRVTFTQGKELRRAIAQTPVKILGRRAEGIVILSGRDTSTGATDFTATAGRNYELRGRRLKVEGGGHLAGRRAGPLPAPGAGHAGREHAHPPGVPSATGPSGGHLRADRHLATLQRGEAAPSAPQRQRRAGGEGIKKEACPQGHASAMISGVLYPPKLSNIRLLIGTPRSSSIFSTALDMGPGPHM